MRRLELVPELPAEDGKEVPTIETFGDLFGDLHAMIEGGADVGAVLLRLAFLAVEHADVRLPNLKRR